MQGAISASRPRRPANIRAVPGDDSGFPGSVRSLGHVEILAAIVAHQGGWDEILLVLLPVAVVGWLLWLAKRRVSRAAVADPSPELGADPPPDQSGD